MRLGPPSSITCHFSTNKLGSHQHDDIADEEHPQKCTEGLVGWTPKPRQKKSLQQEIDDFPENSDEANEMESDKEEL